LCCWNISMQYFAYSLYNSEIRMGILVIVISYPKG
jgi:hypothetical protein